MFALIVAPVHGYGKLTIGFADCMPFAKQRDPAGFSGHFANDGLAVYRSLTTMSDIPADCIAKPVNSGLRRSTSGTSHHER
jgi:hypothetical protein